MTSKERFTVIKNENYEFFDKNKNENMKSSYQTNPLKEQFMRFHNNEVGHKFSIEDLLR